MNEVRKPAAQLDDLVPYDPKYLPAKALLSANENPRDVDADIRQEILREIKKTAFNRYPDPLANDLRDMIADANGLERDWVLMGNGGDELLFDLALAWGGTGRTFLNLPPTFSAYANNARVTNTSIVDIVRREDYSLDEDAILDRVALGDIDFMIVASPNNPTGLMASPEFLERLLDTTDALIMVDEAYFEFSRQTMRPHLETHKNLVILRTFSKAFSLAGVRMGYILGNPEVIQDFIKVRQPYSVDVVSQVIARVVYANRAKFEHNIKAIISERERVYEALRIMPGISPYPTDSNWILFKADRASEAWGYLYDRGVLVRDFSTTPMLEGTLRVTIGTRDENDLFLKNLRAFETSR